TSDVLEIIYFLTDFLKNPERSVARIQSIIENTAGLVDSKGYSIFETSFSYLVSEKIEPIQIFTGINQLVFNNSQIGANLYLDDLKGAEGELGLRVGESAYFGVINVGDERKLYNLAVANGVLGGEKDFSDSLFRGINEDNSSINLLIGSKKFTEGGSSWRVSSMGLMNVGISEGSQIIQLFGRGVRLKGYRFSLKRSQGLDDYQKPENIRALKPVLRHLETLQIFGVQANYMEQFKKFLEEEGLPANDSNWISIQIPVLKKPVVEDKKLQLIRVKDDMSFRRNVLFEVDLSLSRFDGKRIVLDWYPKIDVLQKQRPGVQLQKEEQFLVDAHLELLDWNKMYLEIQAYKDDKGFHNMRLTPESLKKILNNNSWYKILIPSSKFRLNDFQNTFIWQELAETLLKKYIEHYYLFERNEHNAGHVEAIFLDGADENFIFEYDFRLNSEEDIDQYQEKIEQLKQ